jgi:hypothetical protein
MSLAIRRKIAILQGLPILEKLYPAHWIFKEHPSLDAAGTLCADDAAHNTWADWSVLTWDTFCHVSEHVQKSEACGLHIQGTPDFSPPPALLQGACSLGAKWTQWDRTPAEKVNPGFAIAAKCMKELLPSQVQCYAPAFRMCTSTFTCIIHSHRGAFFIG